MDFIFSAFVAIAVVFIAWILHREKYFKNLKIPYTKSVPLLGAFSDTFLGKISFYDKVSDIYNQQQMKGEAFFGFFLCHKPALMIKDLELIKRILVKDFNSFSNRYAASDDHDPLGNFNLFSVKNPLWKHIRAKFTSFFTSGKLKSMFYIIDSISSNMVDHVSQKLNQEGKVELEMKQLALLYATDVIASCAYGVEANSLENPNGEFAKGGKAMFNMNLWRGFEYSCFFMLPQLTKLFRFKAFSYGTTEFIQKTIKHVIDERKKSGIIRNDLIDTIIELKKTDDTLTDDMLIAQAALFFSAGKILFL
jgi:cytochrome P450 family 6